MSHDINDPPGNSDLDVSERSQFFQSASYYPGLEVNGRQHFNDPEAVSHGHGHSHLEVAPIYRTAEGLESNNLQAYHPRVLGNNDASGPIPYDSKFENQDSGSASPLGKKICGMKRKPFWVALAVITLIVIGGIVGGVVGATSHKKSSSSEGSSPLVVVSGTATSTVSSTRTTGTSSSGSLTTPTTVANFGIRPDSKLAALAWTITSTHYQYRVYYQDTDNSIKESAYDSSTGSWKVSKIVDGAGVASGTSIAAS